MIAHSYGDVLLHYVLPIIGGVVLVAALAWFFLSGMGYKKFVAWRYLLVAPQRVARSTRWMLAIGILVRAATALALLRGTPGWENPIWDLGHAAEVFLVVVLVTRVLVYSKPALVAFLLFAVLGAAELVGITLIRHHVIHVAAERAPLYLQVLYIGYAGCFAIAGLAAFFGVLRAFFTFFTTVPVGGVWIGTGALVCVLAVMSGFESDLRQKILGSNAHIQVTKEEGELDHWRQVEKRIDQIPGVVASTPYAMSEVVLAANNNGMSVIIKGIDPKTVGKVTDLVHDLEDHDAMQRLEPLISDRRDLTIPQHPRKPGAEDPPPADMPVGGDPIDFSAPSAPSGEDASDAGVAPDEPGAGALEAPGSATDEPGAAAPPDPAAAPPEGAAGGGDAGPPPGADVEHLGYGDGFEDLDHPVVDPPPPDLLATEDDPLDFSKPHDGDFDPTVHVIDIPDEPEMSERTKSLPGILVGRELVKQTHLYTGEEVRVVSPLSDPSNPDATGTPIPFNRDYRVAGVFFTGMYEYDLKYVYVTLDSLDEFLDRGDTVDGIEVRVTSPDDTDAYVKRIGQVLGPEYRVQDWKELNRSLFSALKLEKIAMFIVLGIVILVASFSIVGNLIMVVVEKGREIALLKTLGASDAGVMQLFAIQGLLIGLVGTALGIATGLLACWAGKRFGIPLDPNVYYIDRMPVHIEWFSVVLTGAAGVLISIAATLYPALLASRVRPATGLRH